MSKQYSTRDALFWWPLALGPIAVVGLAFFMMLLEHHDEVDLMGGVLGITGLALLTIPVIIRFRRKVMGAMQWYFCDDISLIGYTIWIEAGLAGGFISVAVEETPMLETFRYWIVCSLETLLIISIVGCAVALPAAVVYGLYKLARRWRGHFTFA